MQTDTMRARKMARRPGRRGGIARARSLSAERRREIASRGGKGRRDSLLAAKRITANFRYLEALLALQGGPPEITRMKTFMAVCPESTRIGPESEEASIHL
jgi:general stress protein YciG